MAKEFNNTERKGVNKATEIFNDEFDWIFREQAIADMGIDAHVEVVNGKPTGKLIALQIKSGASHFTEKNDCLIYRGKLRHLEYWTNHSLPVIFIAHIPETKKTYWEVVGNKNTERTDKGWKIRIPKNQVLSSDFKDEIQKIAGGTEEMIRRRKLFLDRPLMEAIKNGKKVSVNFMEWLHKSLNRTAIEIIISENGQENIVREWGIMYAGYENEEIMKLIFPWADASEDEDFYELNCDEYSVGGIYNLEYVEEEKFYPYQVLSGEAAEFRLKLELNELGNSFLTYMSFVENGETL